MNFVADGTLLDVVRGADHGWRGPQLSAHTLDSLNTQDLHLPASTHKSLNSDSVDAAPRSKKTISVNPPFVAAAESFGQQIDGHHHSPSSASTEQLTSSASPDFQHLPHPSTYDLQSAEGVAAYKRDRGLRTLADDKEYVKERQKQIYWSSGGRERKRNAYQVRRQLPKGEGPSGEAGTRPIPLVLKTDFPDTPEGRKEWRRAYDAQYRQREGHKEKKKAYNERHRARKQGLASPSSADGSHGAAAVPPSQAPAAFPSVAVQHLQSHAPPSDSRTFHTGAPPAMPLVKPSDEAWLAYAERMLLEASP